MRGLLVHGRLLLCCKLWKPDCHMKKQQSQPGFGVEVAHGFLWGLWDCFKCGKGKICRNQEAELMKRTGKRFPCAEGCSGLVNEWSPGQYKCRIVLCVLQPHSKEGTGVATSIPLHTKGMLKSSDHIWTISSCFVIGKKKLKQYHSSCKLKAHCRCRLHEPSY